LPDSTLAVLIHEGYNVSGLLIATSYLGIGAMYKDYLVNPSKQFRPLLPLLNSMRQVIGNVQLAVIFPNVGMSPAAGGFP